MIKNGVFTKFEMHHRKIYLGNGRKDTSRIILIIVYMAHNLVEKGTCKTCSFDVKGFKILKIHAAIT